MTLITTHQLTTIARASAEEEPADAGVRARLFFARLLGLLSDAENDRLATAMGFDHLTTTGSAELVQRVNHSAHAETAQ